MRYLVQNAQEQDFFKQLPEVGQWVRKIPAHYFYLGNAFASTMDVYAYDAIVLEVNEDHRWYRVYYPEIGKFECFKVPEIKAYYSEKKISVNNTKTTEQEN